MRLSDFDFELPAELIAQHPPAERGASRLLCVRGAALADRLFADLPSAIENTLEIARRCNLSLVLGKPQLPDFPTPDGSPIEAYFRTASHAGLEQRLAHLYPAPAERERQRPTYVQRLDFEIETILKMGFPGYFLIVSDFIT